MGRAAIEYNVKPQEAHKIIASRLDIMSDCGDLIRQYFLALAMVEIKISFVCIDFCRDK